MLNDIWNPGRPSETSMRVIRAILWERRAMHSHPFQKNHVWYYIVVVESSLHSSNFALLLELVCGLNFKPFLPTGTWLFMTRINSIMKQDKHMIWEIHPHHATSSPARAVPKVLDPFCGSGTVLIDAGHAKLSLVFTQNNGIYHVDPFWGS